MSKVQLDRRRIIAAIQKAGKKLGRAPSWAELRRLTGVPESRVRVYFKSLAEAVREAGLKPRRVGLPVTREELLEDFARVTEKLGRRPSRNEYVKLGIYSAGSFYKHFGSWGKIGKKLPGFHPSKPTTGLPGAPVLPGLTIENTKPKPLKRRGREDTEDPERYRSDSVGCDLSPANNLSARAEESLSYEQRSRGSDAEEERGNERIDRNAEVQDVALQPGIVVQRLPAELEGKKRVTAAVCAMIVRTLLGPEAANWREELGVFLGANESIHESKNIEHSGKSTQQSALSIQFTPAGQNRAARGPRIQSLTSVVSPEDVDASGMLRSRNCNEERPRYAGLPLVNLEACSGGVIDKTRAVMGEPFVPLAMTHAPVNELGTMVLFGMLAGLLGFEINAVWGKYPDCNVTQQVEPGKRQAQRVEVEFESRNFARHKHPARKCDVLICWIHNWKECPKRIQVIELKSVVERLLGRKIG